MPPPETEAARDLARARDQLRGDLMRARHRVSKLLLRHGRADQGSTWTEGHRRWLAGQRFELAATELAYHDGLAAIEGLLARREALDRRLSSAALEEPFFLTVARLRCFRGIDTLGPRPASRGARLAALRARQASAGRGRQALRPPAAPGERRLPPGGPAGPRAADRVARAQHRLFRLQARLRRRGKPANPYRVAAARELAC